MTNPEIKVKRRSKVKKDSTQIQMMVESNTEAQYEVFNKEFIINSLSKECGMTLEDALSIANKVEQTLIKSDLKSVSSSYIRSLVNQILGDMGYDKWLKYSSLSIPLYDVKQIIEEHNMENSNTSFSPESVNLTLAGQIIQQYALREVFDPVVADAHLKGEIHLHDLSTANRPYCSGNSVSYIIKNGLKLPNIKTQSAPAQHALTLVNHLSCFTNYLQCYFSGAIGLDSVALFFAPFVINKTKKELKQIAQHLIYCFAQLAGARGGQTAFTDFNMHLRVPKHYADTPALGPGGEYTGKTYKEYENEMREFLRAIFEVLMDGDCNGANFAFPKILLHLDANSFDDNDEILDLACKVNSKRGSIYIIYDRGDTTKISMCCRLSIDMSDEDVKRMSERPEDNRFSALQNITINLPRIAYKYKNIADVQKEITRLLEITMIGHKNKREYISSLLAQGEHGILGFLAKGMDGEPYLDINKVKYLVGMCGLNEMVKCISGEALHESESALKMGLHIIAYMNIEMNRLAKKHGIECLLEESPAESVSGKFALIDIKSYPEAIQMACGDVRAGNVYYTNSVHLQYDSHVDILTRIEKQAKFSPMIKAGSIIHNWFGQSEPDPMALKQLYKTTLFNTMANQTADSPDMTICRSCHTMSKGLDASCSKCGSTDVYSESRITGYYSVISGWTNGKLAELKDRVRVDFNMPLYQSKSDDIEKILFFSKPNCSKCDDLKKILAEKEIVLDVIDTQTPEGLGLGCYFGIDELPCLAKVKGDKVMSKISGKGSYLKWLKDNR